MINKKQNLNSADVNEIYAEMTSIRRAINLFFRKLDFIETILGHALQTPSFDCVEQTAKKIREFLLKKKQASAREIYKKLHLSAEQIFEALEQMDKNGEVVTKKTDRGSTIITLKNSPASDC